MTTHKSSGGETQQGLDFYWNASRKGNALYIQLGAPLILSSFRPAFTTTDFVVVNGVLLPIAALDEKKNQIVCALRGLYLTHSGSSFIGWDDKGRQTYGVHVHVRTPLQNTESLYQGLGQVHAVGALSKYNSTTGIGELLLPVDAHEDVLKVGQHCLLDGIAVALTTRVSGKQWVFQAVAELPRVSGHLPRPVNVEFAGHAAAIAGNLFWKQTLEAYEKEEKARIRVTSPLQAFIIALEMASNGVPPYASPMIPSGAVLVDANTRQLMASARGAPGNGMDAVSVLLSMPRVEQWLSDPQGANYIIYSLLEPFNTHPLGELLSKYKDRLMLLCANLEPMKAWKGKNLARISEELGMDARLWDPSKDGIMSTKPIDMTHYVSPAAAAGEGEEEEDEAKKKNLDERLLNQKEIETMAEFRDELDAFLRAYIHVHVHFFPFITWMRYERTDPNTNMPVVFKDPATEAAVMNPTEMSHDVHLRFRCMEQLAQVIIVNGETITYPVHVPPTETENNGSDETSSSTPTADVGYVLAAPPADTEMDEKEREKWGEPMMVPILPPIVLDEDKRPTFPGKTGTTEEWRRFFYALATTCNVTHVLIHDTVENQCGITHLVDTDMVAQTIVHRTYDKEKTSSLHVSIPAPNQLLTMIVRDFDTPPDLIKDD
jgi:hypothetical protein